MSVRVTPLFSAQRWAQVRASLDELEAQPPDVRRARLQEIAGSDADLAASLQRLLTGPGTCSGRSRRTLCSTPHGRPPTRCRNASARFAFVSALVSVAWVWSILPNASMPTSRSALHSSFWMQAPATWRRLAARERRILSALAHPNITALVDAGVDQGRAWIAMEYVDGDSLLDHCRNLKRGLRERVRLFDQVCAAVAHAHAQLIVHRDLKPSNVLVNTAGNAKLLDFGIALALESTDESAPATRVFTPEYAAPEQLRGGARHHRHRRACAGIDPLRAGVPAPPAGAGARLAQRRMDRRGACAHGFHASGDHCPIGNE
jgi:serine/threonine-protein kinase